MTDADEKWNPFGLPIEDNMSYNQSEHSHLSSGDILDPELHIPSPKEGIRLKTLAPPPVESDFHPEEERKKAFHGRRASSGPELSAVINRWKESEVGDYIEFIIEFSYFVGNRKWEVAKRYSDFVYIHYQILSSNSGKVPPLPPKIDSRKVDQLNIRMQQLEDYINAHLSEYPINPIILEF